MKNYRFYIEHSSKSDKRKLGKNVTVANVLAVSYRDANRMGGMDAIGAVTDVVPSSCIGSSIADAAYLRAYCVRISEAVARSLHPALFASGLL